MVKSPNVLGPTLFTYKSSAAIITNGHTIVERYRVGRIGLMSPARIYSSLAQSLSAILERRKLASVCIGRTSMASRTINRKKDVQRVSAEVPAQVRAKIEEAAACRGVPIDNFVIEAAIQEAERVIEKERLIQLTRDDAELVCSLLDNPPPPNAALRRAVQDHKRLIRG